MTSRLSKTAIVALSGAILFALSYSIALAACNCDRYCNEDYCHAMVFNGGGVTCTYFDPPMAQVEYMYTGTGPGGAPALNGITNVYTGMHCVTYCYEFYGVDCSGDMNEAECAQEDFVTRTDRFICFVAPSH